MAETQFFPELIVVEEDGPPYVVGYHGEEETRDSTYLFHHKWLIIREYGRRGYLVGYPAKKDGRVPGSWLRRDDKAWWLDMGPVHNQHSEVAMIWLSEDDEDLKSALTKKLPGNGNVKVVRVYEYEPGNLFSEVLYAEARNTRTSDITINDGTQPQITDIFN